jgi:hypothetical protein
MPVYWQVAFISGGALLRLLTRPKSIEERGVCGIRVLTGL